MLFPSPCARLAGGERAVTAIVAEVAKRLRPGAHGTVKSVQGEVFSLLVRDATGAERVVPLDQPSLTIGRDEKCEIHIPSAYVSRQHARIELRDDGVFLVDLGSRNGSLLNKVRVQQSAPLRSGDMVEVGDATIECLAGTAAGERTRTLGPRQTEPVAPDRLQVDALTYEVRIGDQLLERRLSAQEFKLLSYLYQHRDRVCARQELGDAIWGAHNWDPNMLHRLVSRLKEKMEPAPERPRYIQTVPWVGYRLTP
jgi:pSer/pThr/pTyr-binding forkhead associated (FHA) protein